MTEGTEKQLIHRTVCKAEQLRGHLTNYCARQCPDTTLCKVCTIQAMNYHLAFFRQLFEGH